MEILGKFKEGFWNFDWIIFVVAIINILIFICIKQINIEISANYKNFEQKENLFATNKAYSQFTNLYTIFLTIISIFPLLGMLGTVFSLLRLDITSIDDNLKSNFFSALTSTAWGIIFAMGFKITNAFISTDVENNIGRLENIIKKFEADGITLKNSEKKSRALK